MWYPKVLDWSFIWLSTKVFCTSIYPQVDKFALVAQPNQFVLESCVRAFIENFEHGWFDPCSFVRTKSFKKFFIFSNTRFAIDSMQSSCLDKVGGEKAADQQIQETSFIQHTFGGHLRSQANALFIYFYGQTRGYVLVDAKFPVFRRTSKIKSLWSGSPEPTYAWSLPR